MFKVEGMITALITPFKNQQVDFESLKRLVDFQLQSGIQGFVINGTTAESPTLENEEVIRIFTSVKDWVPSNFPLIMGTGSNSTKKTIAMTKQAKNLGADAALVVVPYYNKPTQEGLVQHFTAVADAAEMPLLLYNVPSRTVTSLAAETVVSLSAHKNIIGVKEASGDMLVSALIVKGCPKEFSLLSGDDATYLQQALLGGVGCISVLSHVIPQVTVKLLEQARSLDKAAITEFSKWKLLTDLLFKEPNPAPVKYALKKMGIIESDELRLPLVSASTGLAKLIDQELVKLELV